MKAIILLLSFMIVPAIAWAGQDLKQCFSAHNECVTGCFELENKSAQATCIAQCAGTEAKCAGEIGLESSKPYIRDKAEQLEKLLQEFFNDVLPIPEQSPEAEPESTPSQTTT